MRAHTIVILAGALALSVAAPASAQQTIKIGELNSYKAQPAFPRSLQEGLGNGGRRNQCRRRRLGQEA